MTAAEHQQGAARQIPADDGAHRAAAPRPWTVPGLAARTPVATACGDIPAHLLRERDLVLTAGGQYARIAWLDRIRLDTDFLSRHPGARPVLVRAGAFAPGVPATDLMVSPGQTIGPADRLSGGALTPAAQLVAPPDIAPATVTDVTYTVFHCGEPVSVAMGGLWAHLAP
ncbi:Hint domain-containing protein [Rhodovulum sp. YNF3179]|uniref:Hint domain-containing protein n=1 Tax=Rhodovulum sp. YNF3179 TaxID=3425127 RepID=UPI003D325509